MEEKLTRLYFKDNKKKILEIMHHINPKYLIGLWRNVRKKQIMAGYNNECIGDYYNEDEWKKTYVDVKVPVKYDGYIFYASVKTIKEEINRRKELGEIYDEFVWVTNWHYRSHLEHASKPQKDKKSLNKYDDTRKANKRN